MSKATTGTGATSRSTEVPQARTWYALAVTRLAPDTAVVATQGGVDRARRRPRLGFLRSRRVRHRLPTSPTRHDTLGGRKTRLDCSGWPP